MVVVLFGSMNGEQYSKKNNKYDGNREKDEQYKNRIGEDLATVHKPKLNIKVLLGSSP